MGACRLFLVKPDKASPMLKRASRQHEGMVGLILSFEPWPLLLNP